MEYNIHKICRVCLDDGAVTSIYSTEFAMMPSTMMMMCAKIKVHKSDGLPAVICNNCIYRLGVAYHFKQECENSDIRLRQYLGLSDRPYSFCDAGTNTEVLTDNQSSCLEANKCFGADDEQSSDSKRKKIKHKQRYERKPPEKHKKRGPKPLPRLPQNCYDCNKTFKCSAQLQMHMRTHTGEKPFSCNYCSRRFAQKYNLYIHERTHTGERPFQCEICSKQFSALGNFQAHQKIHSGVRDHCCPVCQKSFYSVGDLSKHMIIHTGIKNHHCDVCGKTFSRQRDVQSHKQKMHVMQERVKISEEVNTEQVSTNVADNFKCRDCIKETPSSGCFSAHFRTNNNSNFLPTPLTAQTHPHDHHYPISHESIHHLHAVAPPNNSNISLAPAQQAITTSIFNGPLPSVSITNPSSLGMTTTNYIPAN